MSSWDTDDYTLRQAADAIREVNTSRRRLDQARAERDRARDLAASLEAELARVMGDL